MAYLVKDADSTVASRILLAFPDMPYRGIWRRQINQYSMNSICGRMVRRCFGTGVTSISGNAPIKQTLFERYCYYSLASASVRSELPLRITLFARQRSRVGIPSVAYLFAGFLQPDYQS